MNNIFELFQKSFETWKNKVFIVDAEKKDYLTFNNVVQDSKLLASFIRKNTDSKYPRILYITNRNNNFFSLFCSASLLKGILFPINGNLSPKFLKKRIKRVDPDIIFFDDEYKNKGFKLNQTLSELRNNGNSNQEFEISNSNSNFDLDTEVLCIFTSGTTSGGDGVVLTNGNLISMAKTFKEVYNLSPNQKIVSMLPYFHINAIMITGIISAYSGLEVHAFNPFNIQNAFKILPYAAKNDINILSLTPSIMAGFLKIYNRSNLPSLKLNFSFSGTAALSKKIWENFESLMNSPVYQGYGLTETTTWSTFSVPNEIATKVDVGYPKGCSIKIDGEENVGEILIKGPTVMSRYWNDPHKTNLHIDKEGWFHTGDIGEINIDGTLTIKGRKKNIIKRRGELILPIDIESCINNIRGVESVSVIGVPNDLNGENIACFFEGRLSEAEFKVSATKNLPEQIVPDHFQKVGLIPKNVMGKYDINSLRKIFTGEMAIDLFNSINTNKFMKSSPKDINEILDIFKKSLISNNKIRLLNYWGCGPLKKYSDDVDKSALKRLKDLRVRLKNIYPNFNVVITIILADVHCRANLIPDNVYKEYTKKIVDIAKLFDFEITYLSQIWKSIGLSENDINNWTIQDEKKWIEFDLKDQFIEQAKNVDLTGKNREAFAKRYFKILQLENEPLSKYFLGSVFCTYNKPSYTKFLPDLPIFYLHSLRGLSSKPWFINEDIRKVSIKINENEILI